MKPLSLINFFVFGISTILFRRKKAILGTIILTDKCNLSCKHCAVNNITAVIYPYEQIQREMRSLYHMGIRILFFCGGETFLWEDSGKNLRDLVREAKVMGFLIVNVVTNGTFPLDLPEADLILLSLDGDRQRHNHIRGDTFDRIMQNIARAASDNICLYMAINQINQGSILPVCEIARDQRNIRAVSFNFHTPYPGTEALALTASEKQQCCDDIAGLIGNDFPIFNLQSAFPYVVSGKFPTPCRQCVVMEKGELSVCGRCVNIPGLCEKCGYFFAAEYSLVFSGKLRVIFDMLRTYLKYI
ncbi:MAG: radical SAM protein [Peptococcaceae bacterium]|jgi:MoaA/NifB/PqqE/SkfB family radical SAM enzyme|nr:radical SAM protein [Peptococcaceae bacterium]